MILSLSDPDLNLKLCVCCEQTVYSLLISTYSLGNSEAIKYKMRKPISCTVVPIGYIAN